VAPAEDERDAISNVTPRGQFLGHALYEYLPVFGPVKFGRDALRLAV